MHCGSQAKDTHKARGEYGVSPFGSMLASHFQAARDDRDGRSRYRAAKMQAWPVIRVVPRFKSPLFLGATFYFANDLWRKIQ